MPCVSRRTRTRPCCGSGTTIDSTARRAGRDRGPIGSIVPGCDRARRPGPSPRSARSSWRFTPRPTPLPTAGPARARPARRPSDRHPDAATLASPAASRTPPRSRLPRCGTRCGPRGSACGTRARAPDFPSSWATTPERRGLVRSSLPRAFAASIPPGPSAAAPIFARRPRDREGRAAGLPATWRARSAGASPISRPNSIRGTRDLVR